MPELVKVYGTFRRTDGLPARGVVQISPRSSNDPLIGDQPIFVWLRDGVLVTNLYATPEADGGVSYTFTKKFGDKRSFDVTLTTEMADGMNNVKLEDLVG